MMGHRDRNQINLVLCIGYVMLCKQLAQKLVYLFAFYYLLLPIVILLYISATKFVLNLPYLVMQPPAYSLHNLNFSRPLPVTFTFEILFFTKFYNKLAALSNLQSVSLAVTGLPWTCVYTFMNFLYLQVLSVVRSPFQKEITILLEPATCINEQMAVGFRAVKLCLFQLSDY